AFIRVSLFLIMPKRPTLQQFSFPEAVRRRFEQASGWRCAPPKPYASKNTSPTKINTQKKSLTFFKPQKYPLTIFIPRNNSLTYFKPKKTSLTMK
ncbi:MAG TPA: hypothetical protein O0X70_07415, partial [Methanocorpusculum sp.]|nr:hypothetical protein [Methanocorpusculum sp.]